MRRLIMGTIFAGAAIFSSVGIFFAACDSTPPPVGVGGTSGGGGGGGLTINTSPTAGASGSGATTGGGGQPTGDANCGTQTKNTAHQLADVLLVLDRSGSMDYSTAEDCYCDATTAGSNGKTCSSTTNCTTRWPALTSAVTATLGSTSGSINWGLKLFSSTGSGCGLNNGVEVAISATSVSAIEAKVTATTPGGNTPTAQAITAATAYLKTVNDQNSKYILLATDGEPNCAKGGDSSPNVQATVDAITAAKNLGFLVYVIGIGPQAALTNLQSFAVAGGTTNYYPAASPQALADAFSKITVAVVSCTFALDQTPPDPTNIGVYLDGKGVDKDATNGWSYGANTQTIVLNGTTCDQITSGKGSTVQVFFGCAGGPPPPPILY